MKLLSYFTTIFLMTTMAGVAGEAPQDPLMARIDLRDLKTKERFIKDLKRSGKLVAAIQAPLQEKIAELEKIAERDSLPSEYTLRYVEAGGKSTNYPVTSILLAPNDRLARLRALVFKNYPHRPAHRLELSSNGVDLWQPDDTLVKDLNLSRIIEIRPVA